MAQKKHPFVAALIADGLTVAEIADDLKRSPSTVKAWYKPANDKQSRPIPREIAKTIQKRFGKDAERQWRVPLSAWARIAD